MPTIFLNKNQYASNGGKEMVLTQTQYDNLSEQDKMNGMTYYICDADSDKNGDFQPIIYSTSEKEIGVWCDGKLLYQKTEFFNSQIVINSSSWTTAQIGVNNIDRIISVIGYDGTSSAFYMLGARINNNSFQLFCPVTVGINGLTLQYTKTTDTPGSGSWTPGGTPAVHYDGNEKVIGTWFGETLYEKSYQVTGIKGDNVIVDATLTPSAIRPIHIYSSFYITGGAYQGVSFAHELTNGQFLRVGVSPSQGLFCDIDGYNTNYFGTDGANVYITIQYIKITTL